MVLPSVFLTGNYSALKSTLQLLGLLIVFIIILVAAYYTSRFIGKSDFSFGMNRNIKVVEACRISPTVTIQIVKAGDRFLLIGVSKERVTFLTELSGDSLTLTENQPDNQMDFSAIMEKVASKVKKDKKKPGK